MGREVVKEKNLKITEEERLALASVRQDGNKVVHEIQPFRAEELKIHFKRLGLSKLQKEVMFKLLHLEIK